MQRKVYLRGYLIVVVSVDFGDYVEDGFFVANAPEHSLHLVKCYLAVVVLFIRCLI